MLVRHGIISWHQENAGNALHAVAEGAQLE